MKRNIRVFVYGSLMRGLGNHSLLRDADFIGECRTARRFIMRAVGKHSSFPAITPWDDEDGVRITGELYAVNAAELAKLDRLEGHPRWYQREPIELDEYTVAYCYIMPDDRIDPDWPIVEHGDWKRSPSEIERAVEDALRERRANTYW